MTAPPSVPPSTATGLHQYQRHYGAYFVWAVAGALVVRFYWVVSRYSVNLFFFDEWDVYAGLFRGWPWWKFFLQEHGPHRQGLGVAVVVWLLRATHWDSRVQAYAIAGAIVLAMLLAIRLKLWLFGPLQFFDVIIPIVFLGLGQWEVLLSAPGPSAQAFPLLLLTVYCLSWLVMKTCVRYTSIVLANFLLIYTGYGIFVLPITLLLLAIDCWQNRRKAAELIAPFSALVLSALSLALFLHKYVFNPAADCFHFPYHNPAAYPWFMGLMLAKFLGIKHGTMLPGVIGLLVLLIIIAVCVRSLWVLIKDMNPRAVIVLILTGYTLIYAAAAAIGRVCMGLEAAQSSRNLTLLIPAFIGIYFYLLSLNPIGKARIATAVLLLAVLPGCIQRNHKEIEGFSGMKTAWKACYLANEKIAYCDAVSHLQLYPHPDAIDLSNKLDYLKRKHLNLYKSSS